MRFGNYSLLIPEGTERDSGYVAVPHATPYTVRIGNHGNRKAQADVSLDGKLVGSFVLYQWQVADIEHGVTDHGRFTFYADETAEALQAGGLAVSESDRGLVQVIFTPEKVERPKPTSVLRSFVGETEEKTSGGITGLSGHSNQSFREVSGFPLDETGRVTITLRLVRRNDGPRPLVGVVAGNPVPPPVS